jgi:glutathione S-transferase
MAPQQRALLFAGAAASGAALAYAFFSWLSSPRKPRSLTLEYFDIAGKGEPIRLLAKHLGLELNDTRLSREDFNERKLAGRYAFGQVPSLEVGLPGGSERLAQTNAILRYLCVTCGAHPAAAEDAALVDSLLDFEADLTRGLMVIRYGPRFGIELDDEQKAASLEAYSKTVLPRQLAHLERALSNSRSGWLAGTREPTAADFCYAPLLLGLIGRRQQAYDPGPLRASFPLVASFVEKFYRLPAVQEYYGRVVTLDSPDA